MTTRPETPLAWLLAGLISALTIGVSLDASAGRYRMKINAIDVTHAPEIAIFFTFLDPKDRPIPPKKVQDADVFMDGKPVERGAEVIGLKESDHRVAVAFVACGYRGYAKKKIAKAQAKGFGELVKLARDTDIGTAFAYTNNIRNLTKGKFVPLAEAQAAVAEVEPSDTAYRAKLYDTVMQTVQMFQANDSHLPTNRIIVLMSDGADDTTASDTEAEHKIFRIVQAAKKAGVRIMTLAYSDVSDVYFSNLELLARKSGGTHRVAKRIKDVPVLFKYIAAEIWGQMVVEVVPPMKARRPHRFYVAVQYRGKRFHTSQKVPFEVKVKKLHFRWKHWGIVALIVLAIIIVLVIILIIVLKIRKKRKRKKEIEKLKAEEEAEEDEDEDDEDDEDEAPPKKKGEKKGKKKAGAGVEKKKGGKGGEEEDEDDEDGAGEARVCPTCGRTMLPNWKECMFCKAGIGKKR